MARLGLLWAWWLHTHVSICYRIQYLCSYISLLVSYNILLSVFIKYLGQFFVYFHWAYIMLWFQVIFPIILKRESYKIKKFHIAKLLQLSHISINVQSSVVERYPMSSLFPTLKQLLLSFLSFSFLCACCPSYLLSSPQLFESSRPRVVSFFSLHQFSFPSVIGDLGLAQHCLIRACEIQPSAVTWTHLGAFYLSREDTDLAHEAFSQAQAHDPAYVGCWVGQVSWRALYRTILYTITAWIAIIKYISCCV